MPTINLFARSNRNAGTRSFGPVTIPQGISRIVVTATRENWPDTGSDIVTFTAEVSLDGGQTWQLAVRFTAPGGDVLAPDGTVAPASVVSIPLVRPDLSGRLILATLTNTATFRTQVTVDTF